MIGKTISHYKILEKIGEGGMGVIFKAEDTILKRIVALKFLPSHLLGNEEEKTRFLHEAQAASALNHPNIMTIYEISETEEETFIAMEYLEGETLKDRILEGPLHPKDILPLAIETVEGLHAAHTQNIIHRDIKSENLMITSGGHVKIMDFGLAKRKGASRLTRAGTTLGTMAYMSPEQAEGREVDQRSDIFSCGVCLYEMSTGSLPFRGDHEAAILYSIVNEPPMPAQMANPKIPEELERIIHKALEKDTEDRYQHGDDLLADLKKLKKDLDSGKSILRIKSSTPKSFEPPKKPFYKKPAALSAMVIVVVLGFVGLLQIGKNSTHPAPAVRANSLAVLYFENLKDPEDPDRLGQILQELVITDLSDIVSLKVFSSQRLFDIQKQLGSKDRKRIDPELATEIVRHAGAQTMLTGSVIQTGDKIILTSQLSDAASGTVIESQRVEGTDIFTLADELSRQIQKELRLPEMEADPVAVAVKEKTSSSLSAYQYYLAGVDLLNASRFDSAIVLFNKALSIDSTFSQAYYEKALTQWWAQSESSVATIEQARESLSHILSGAWYTSTKDKLMAQGAMALIDQDWDTAQETYQQLVEFLPDEKGAWYGLGEAHFHGDQNFSKALDAFEQVIYFDPEFTLAYRHIFDIYEVKEQFDRGIIKASQFVTIQPDDPWGYYYIGKMFRGKRNYQRALEVLDQSLELDPEFKPAQFELLMVYESASWFEEGIKRGEEWAAERPENEITYNFLGQMYRGNGDYRQAIGAFLKGLLVNPRAFYLINNLGYTYQLMGLYDEAVKTFTQLLREKIPPNWQAAGFGSLTGVYGERGRYSQVLELMNENLSANPDWMEPVNARLNVAFISHLQGDTATALASLQRIRRDIPTPVSTLISYWLEGMICAEGNQVGQLNALINTVEIYLNQEDVAAQFEKVLTGLLFEKHILDDNLDEALKEFEVLQTGKLSRDRYLYRLALYQLKNGNYESALDLTRQMESPTISRDTRSFNYARSFYLRGRIYEELGNLDQAKDNYERFLKIWDEADESIPERKDAGERLDRIIKMIG